MSSITKEIVNQRLSDMGPSEAPFSQVVSFRLDPSEVQQLEVLAKHLGYRSKGGLIRDLVSNSIEDITLETARQLKNTDRSAIFTADMHEALASR